MIDKPKSNQDDGLAETKRIMERLVRTPPKPHKPQHGGKKGESPEKRSPAKKPGSD